MSYLHQSYSIHIISISNNPINDTVLHHFLFIRQCILYNLQISLYLSFKIFILFVFITYFRYNGKERVRALECFYQSMLAYIRQRPRLEKIIIFLTQYCPYVTFILYPCVLIYLWYIHSPYLIDAILRPCIAFVIVTVFRKIVNRPRPYDHMDIQPLRGHKHGESFPSRHTVSACIIAFVCFYAHFYIGVFACIIALIVSLTRILSGVHHISDVFVAIIIAILCFIIDFH